MLELNSVHLGDCLEVMNGIDNKSVDMILCDLPYGTTACKWDVIIPFDSLWKHYKRIIKDKGAIVLFGTEPFSSYLRLSNLSWYKYDLYWKKEKPTNFFQLKRRFGKSSENICIFYNSQCTYNPQMVKSNHTSGFIKNKPGTTHSSVITGISKKQITPYNDNGLRYPNDFLEFRREKLGTTLHETQKPVSLCEYLIKTYTNEGDLVLDNCAGSGTTGVACQNLNRNFILIEKELEYYEIIKKRLAGELNLKSPKKQIDNIIKEGSFF
jgi:DNA modification methylase